MKILVLGNGFDLDHNLPTSYKDFLNFCDYALNIDFLKEEPFDKLTKIQCEYAKLLKKNKEIRDTFLSLIKNNPFLNYFSIEYERQGNNWIDFEREIKNIITEFKLLEYNLSQSSKYSIDTDKTHIIHEIIEKLGLGRFDTDSWNDSRLSNVHKRLCDALNDFSLALEYYISVFINTTPINSISPDIIEFDADRILTFNYSDTYERIYGGVHWGEIIDHVHGIATDTLEEPNIILGITRNNYEINANNYVEFEKYFQRITKKTGNEYSKWLTERGVSEKEIEILFFGHSLDSSDSDIIQELIRNKKTRITILYYNHKSLQDIVANLTEIIGKEDLITAVSGNTPKIIFKQQQKHKSNDTAGIEIERDVRKLYKLYLLDDTSVENLLKKIDHKVNEKDLLYFFNQRKVIDLFEALKYSNVKKYDSKTFFEICKCLDFEISEREKLVYYRYEDWYGETSYGDEIICDEDTKTLIDLINKDNQVRIKFLYDKKIWSNIQNMQTSEEIKNALIGILLESNPTKQYWKDLNKLIVIMAENKLFEEAMELVKQEDLTIPAKSKLKHFENEYYEYCINLDYAR